MSFLLTLGFVACPSDTLGEITWCLSMHIQTSTDRHVITLDLDQYIQTIDQLQPVPTPMVYDLKLSKDDCPVSDSERDCMDQYSFLSAISSLMFAMVAMRVDILYADTSVTRFTANSGLLHWIALVRIFQYIKGISDMKITPLLYGYSDADWATTDVSDELVMDIVSS